MKMTDKVILHALYEGKRIIRSTWRNYYKESDIPYIMHNDGLILCHLPHISEDTHYYSISWLDVDDWELME